MLGSHIPVLWKGLTKGERFWFSLLALPTLEKEMDVPQKISTEVAQYIHTHATEWKSNYQISSDDLSTLSVKIQAYRQEFSDDLTIKAAFSDFDEAIEQFQKTFNTR